MRINMKTSFQSSAPSYGSVVARAAQGIPDKLHFRKAHVCSRRRERLSKCSAARAEPLSEEEFSTPGRLRRFEEEEAQPSADELEQDRESRECAVALAKVAWDTKADDICVLHVAPLVYWCSYMVVLNVTSRPQLQAVLAKIEKEAAERWNRHISEDATSSRKSSWEVLDFQDVVVQVFTPEQREFYDLDGYYGLAEEVDLPFLAEEKESLQWSKRAGG